MCESDLEIHFCTCASMQKEIFPSQFRNIDNNRNEYEKTRLIWKFYGYIGEKDSIMMGDMIMPVDQMDQDLTTNFLIKQLNSGNSFDFDYSPAQVDNLEIRKEYIYKKEKGQPRRDLYNFISFIYRNRKWKDDVYNVFSDKIKRLNKGKICINFKGNVQ